MKKAKLSLYFNEWLKVKIEYKSEKEALKAVEQNGYALRYVKEQTEAVCLKAVEKNGYALRYVDSVFFTNCVEDKKYYK